MTQADIVPLRRRPFHPGLVASAATLLMATLASDYLYWDNFSGWLLTGGLILTLLAAIAFVIDLVLGRVRKVAWLRFAGLAVAALLGILNALVHSRDAYPAVVPEGITLSAIITVILLVVGIGGGWSLASRHVPLPYNEGVRS
jgi:uncharacterized membrane protein